MTWMGRCTFGFRELHMVCLYEVPIGVTRCDSLNLLELERKMEMYTMIPRD